jgi:peroxiredoxin
MHSDFGPGRTFPDFVLPDRTNTEHQLSALQGGDPMLVVLIRSLLCAKDREQLASLARVHALLGEGCCKLVAITTDASPAEAAEAAALSVLLHDQAQHVRDTLDIAVLTDDGDEPPLIPHTFLLAPGLSIRKVWNGRHPWGRPSSCELHDALCELTRELRRELHPRPGAGAASLDQTLGDMVAASRDAGRVAAPRSMS